MEFGQLMIDILVYVSCKFEMYIFKIAQVISENVRIACLYVLSIETTSNFTNKREMQNDENVRRCLNKQQSSRLFTNNFASCIYDCAAVHRAT